MNQGVDPWTRKAQRGTSHRLGIADFAWHSFGTISPNISHGYKIHVSLGPHNINRVAPPLIDLLLREKIAFKIASSEEMIRMLNEGHLGLSQVGKSMTTYHTDAADIRRGSDLLLAITRGEVGPKPPSDRRIPGSECLSYRFGTLVGQGIEGERRATMTIPPGIEDPFPEATDQSRSLTKLRTSYLFLDVLHRTGSSAIYKAFSIRNRRLVALREAKKYGAIESRGRHAWHRLQTQREMLFLLAGTGLVPDCDALIEIDDSMFLPMEYMSGFTSLDQIRNLPITSIRRVFEQTLSVLATLHKNGLVWGDISAGNVLMNDNGACCFVDFESVLECGEPVGSGTWPYAAHRRSTADPHDDFYALATLGLVLDSDFPIEAGPNGGSVPSLNYFPRRVFDSRNLVHQEVSQLIVSRGLSLSRLFSD